MQRSASPPTDPSLCHPRSSATACYWDRPPRRALRRPLLSRSHDEHFALEDLACTPMLRPRAAPPYVRATLTRAKTRAVVMYRQIRIVHRAVKLKPNPVLERAWMAAPTQSAQT